MPGLQLRPIRSPGRAAALLLAAAALLSLSGGVSSATASATERLTLTPGELHIVEPGYQLAVDPHTGIVSLASPSGLLFTSFPLEAGVGAPPGDGIWDVRTLGGGITATLQARGGGILSQATLVPAEHHVTIRFGVRPQRGSAVTFFGNGSRGIDTSLLDRSFDAATGHLGYDLPLHLDSARAPLTPAPMVLQLHAAPGWIGIGLEQVPDASRMQLTPEHTITMDYPATQLAGVDDTGAGGRCGSLLCLPAFTVTTASDPVSGIAAYRRALLDLRAVPANTSAIAPWWTEPMVVTAGAQDAGHVQHGKPGFNAAWVSHFATTWQSTYGVRHITLVIDSRWQQQIGSPEPDVRRFGGVAGMRALVDSLHARGMKVMFWWPLWSYHLTAVPPGPQDIRRAGERGIVDPTAPGFDSEMRSTVTTMLSSAPGCLDADGLKIDWQYDEPPQLADVARGYGDAALLHYLSVIHETAHAVKHDALVETSAATPQFAAVTDAVRLYDAWSQGDWDARARVVAASLPGTLIDGDGWETTRLDAEQHAASSAVYGIPAVYFGSTWDNGAPIPAWQMRLIGLLASLAQAKGPGTATWTGTDWIWTSGGHVRAETLNGEQAVVVWWASLRAARVVALTPGVYDVPLPSAADRQCSQPILTGNGAREVRLRFQWAGELDVTCR